MCHVIVVNTSVGGKAIELILPPMVTSKVTATPIQGIHVFWSCAL